MIDGLPERQALAELSQAGGRLSLADWKAIGEETLVWPRLAEA